MAAHYHLVNHTEKEQFYIGKPITNELETRCFSSVTAEALASYIAEHVEDELEFCEGYSFDEKRYGLDYADATPTPTGA
jgi:hypothetical protein